MTFRRYAMGNVKNYKKYCKCINRHGLNKQPNKSVPKLMEPHMTEQYLKVKRTLNPWERYIKTPSNNLEKKKEIFMMWFRFFIAILPSILIMIFITWCS